MPYTKLFEEVISKNLCTDCGACVMTCPRQAITMQETPTSFEPVLTGNCLGDKCTICSDACPGAFVPRSKAEETFFGRVRKDDGIENTQGVLRDVSIGQWDDQDVLQESGSGGFVTGLLTFALEQGLIDGAVVSVPNSKYPYLSEARVATTRQELIEAAGSRYDSYPHLLGIKKAYEMGLKQIAVVCLPCHANALRKMMMQKKYAKYTGIIRYMLGLWCVCNFTRTGVQFLMEEKFGVPKEEVAWMSYRKRPFSGTVVVRTRDGEEKREGFVTRHVYHRLSSSFMLDACRNCVDAQCDLADLSFGDPWGYKLDDNALSTGYGFSTCLVRSEKGEELVRQAREAGKFRYFEEVAPEDRWFLPKTGAVITKCYGHKTSIESRKKHGIATRIVE